MTNRKIENGTKVILSCVISYVIISLVSLVKQIDDTLILSGITIIVSTILSIMGSLLLKSNKFKSFLVKRFYKTPSESIWDDVIDFKSGSNLKVFLKDKDYYLLGHYKNNENNGKDSWMALSAFGGYYTKTNNPTDEVYHGDEGKIVTFKLEDVERIEIY